MRSGPLALGALVVVGVLAAAAPSAADPKQDVVVTFSDPGIVESSGLVARDGDFLTINDSGDTGLVYVVDGETGATIGKTFWSDTPEDVEALAPATGTEVWVGDIGDNKEKRPWVEVTLVDVQPGDRSQAGTTYRLGYPHGAANAEALLVNPVDGRLYVASKVLLGGALYAAPKTLDPIKVNALQQLGPVGNLVTDGAFFPDGRHLILRGYGKATVYSFPDMAVLGTFDLPEEPQGEGIAVSADGEVFVCSEGSEQPVLRVALPQGIADRVAPAPAPTTSSGDDDPSPADPAQAESGGPGLPVLLGGGLVLLAVVGGGAAAVVRSRRSS